MQIYCYLINSDVFYRRCVSVSEKCVHCTWVFYLFVVYHVHAVPGKPEEGVIPSNWTYMWLWAPEWVLGIKPSSSARTQAPLTTEPSCSCQPGTVVHSFQIKTLTGVSSAFCWEWSRIYSVFQAGLELGILLPQLPFFKDKRLQQQCFSLWMITVEFWQFFFFHGL